MTMVNGFMPMLLITEIYEILRKKLTKQNTDLMDSISLFDYQRVVIDIMKILF